MLPQAVFLQHLDVLLPVHHLRSGGLFCLGDGGAQNIARHLLQLRSLVSVRDGRTASFDLGETIEHILRILDAMLPRDAFDGLGAQFRLIRRLQRALRHRLAISRRADDLAGRLFESVHGLLRVIHCRDVILQRPAAHRATRFGHIRLAIRRPHLHLSLMPGTANSIGSRRGIHGHAKLTGGLQNACFHSHLSRFARLRVRRTFDADLVEDFRRFLRRAVTTATVKVAIHAAMVRIIDLRARGLFQFVAGGCGTSHHIAIRLLHHAFVHDVAIGGELFACVAVRVVLRLYRRLFGRAFWHGLDPGEAVFVTLDLRIPARLDLLPLLLQIGDHLLARGACLHRETLRFALMAQHFFAQLRIPLRAGSLLHDLLMPHLKTLLLGRTRGIERFVAHHQLARLGRRDAGDQAKQERELFHGVVPFHSAMSFCA